MCYTFILHYRILRVVQRFRNSRQVVVGFVWIFSDPPSIALVPLVILLDPFEFRFLGLVQLLNFSDVCSARVSRLVFFSGLGLIFSKKKKVKKKKFLMNK